MININKLTIADIKRQVIYTPFKGCDEEEEGIITSFNDKYIFVDYGRNCGRGTATSPNDLRFSHV